MRFNSQRKAFHRVNARLLAIRSRGMRNDDMYYYVIYKTGKYLVQCMLFSMETI